jgi:dihydropyrimidinase
VGQWDVAVQGERIVAVAEPDTLTRDVGRIIDAGHQLVIPGGIEPHAHASFRFVYPWAREAGHQAAGPDQISRACAFGGTTTVVDFANWRPGGTLQTAIEDRDRLYKGQSCVDYSFHTVLFGMGTEGSSPDQGVTFPLSLIDETRELIRSGFSTIKVWTTNTTATRNRQMTDLGQVWAIMKSVAAAGGVLVVIGFE